MSTKKQIKQQTENEKNLFMEEFKNLYIDDVMADLYESEKANYYKYIDELVQTRLGNVIAKKKEVESKMNELNE